MTFKRIIFSFRIFRQ